MTHVFEDGLGNVFPICGLIDKWGRKTKDESSASTATVKLDEHNFIVIDLSEQKIYTVH